MGHPLVIAEIAKLVGFDFVSLGFGVVHVALACAEAPRTLHNAFPAEKIGGLDGISLIGGAEDHSVAEVQRQHL